MIGVKIHITGIVQGVGFRPFIYNLAIQRGLRGWVRNTSAGVDIEVTGEPARIDEFINLIESNPPPLARIDSLESHQVPTDHHDSFIIIESKEVAEAYQPISPDICICEDCLKELMDPGDRRFRYPFINCTNCGPRLTIIEDIPYDRPNTTMKGFNMCHDCAREYSDPTDRRFHAQPIACPVCGPQVWLEIPDKKNHLQNHPVKKVDEAINAAQKLLKKGAIVAIKGLGGFHLACDATNSSAVAELRRRKLRIDKPFGLMMPNIATVEAHCLIARSDIELIESHQRPIVIVPRLKDSSIAREVAPGQDTLGVMLPYTPLHYLLFASPRVNKKYAREYSTTFLPPLVMTSGNLSEEPIAISNDDARERLSGLADAFLMHNRDIRTRCDDSVVRTFRGATLPLRRSRGYAPFPVYLNSNSPQVLAVGAELKNTFCITHDRYAFLSHHIGDMENIETYNSFSESVSRYETLFRVKPEAIAYDLHPDYLATRYAFDRARGDNLPLFGVQHHHAHVASCMAENSFNADRPVIGVAFDGTGYGIDGAIWGGEFLLADYQDFRRVGHLKYIPLPGGDTAIRKPARTALAYLWSCNMDWEPNYYPVFALCAEERIIIKSQLEKKINTPLTSSMGRFFDAVAAIAGVRQMVNYEAQAAIEFEALADPYENGAYNLDLELDTFSDQPTYQVDPSPLIEELLIDVQKGTSTSVISARFHNSLALMVSNVCSKLRSDHGANDVFLSGGVWQNMTLLRLTCSLLEKSKFTVHIHNQVPPNDAGLALGQAVVAIHRMAKG